MTTKLKLSIGDKVTMSKTTQYEESPSNPRDVTGIINGFVYGDTYKVDWGDDNTNDGYTDDDIELVVEEVEKVTIAQSIENLILLEDVDKAHKKESEGWFKSMLGLLSPVLESDWTQFFSDYEERYKKEASVTSMPITYRTAKSVIRKGFENDVEGMFDNMGKTAIEKAIKEKRSKEQGVPITDEELLGTIIAHADKIHELLMSLPITSEEYKEAQAYIKVAGRLYDQTLST